MMTAPPMQAAFYRQFVMARKLEPREYGVNMFAGGQLQFDLSRPVDRGRACLHPREALWFCDEVRRRHEFA